LAAKHGVTVLNTPGTIDADYRGEVGVLLINHGEVPLTIRRGERIAQMVIAPVTRRNSSPFQNSRQRIAAVAVLGRRGADNASIFRKIPRQTLTPRIFLQCSLRSRFGLLPRLPKGIL